MKIIGLSGSLREGSLNTQLLRAIARKLPSDVEYSEESIALPLYDGNEDRTKLSSDIVEMRDKVQNADALIITTPEYNWSMTAAMKNFIDWMSLGGPNSPLNHHVVALAGVGGGRLGSVRAQMAIRSVLLHNKVWVVPGPEVLIAPREDLFDSNGDVDDDFANSLIDQVLEELVRVTPHLRKR